MDRRKFIGTSVVAGAGLAVAAKCGGKAVTAEVTIIKGAISELQLLYPTTTILGKIAKLADDFNADWTAGKFDSAKALFENLDTLIGQAINDLGVNASTRAKLLLATIGIALRAIAALISEQAQSAGVSAKAGAMAGPATVDRVRVLASDATATSLLNSVRQP